jgi:hypothetical protein
VASAGDAGGDDWDSIQEEEEKCLLWRGTLRISGGRGSNRLIMQVM